MQQHGPSTLDDEARAFLLQLRVALPLLLLADSGLQ
jgi:hypothetical protein